MSLSVDLLPQTSVVENAPTSRLSGLGPFKSSWFSMLRLMEVRRGDQKFTYGSYLGGSRLWTDSIHRTVVGGQEVMICLVGLFLVSAGMAACHFLHGRVGVPATLQVNENTTCETTTLGAFFDNGDHERCVSQSYRIARTGVLLILMLHGTGALGRWSFLGRTPAIVGKRQLCMTALATK